MNLSQQLQNSGTNWAAMGTYGCYHIWVMRNKRLCDLHFVMPQNLENEICKNVSLYRVSRNLQNKVQLLHNR